MLVIKNKDYNLKSTYTKYSKDRIQFEILLDERLSNLYKELFDNYAVLSLANDFENNKWRINKFEDFIFNNIKEVALTKKEIEALNGEPWSIIKKSISNLRIDENLSELGEIILYGILKEYYSALPIVPKVFYKQNKNDCVKGADSIHITLCNNGKCHLWLGESKFYSDLDSAIDSACDSVYEILQDEKLSKEKSIIANLSDIKENLGDCSESFLQVLSDRVSLDEIKKILHIPISIIYECKDTQEHLKKQPVEFNTAYKNILIDKHKEKCKVISQKLNNKLKNIPFVEKIKFHIIIFPISNKQEIIQQIKNKFKALK